MFIKQDLWSPSFKRDIALSVQKNPEQNNAGFPPFSPNAVTGEIQAESCIVVSWRNGPSVDDYLLNDWIAC